MSKKMDKFLNPKKNMDEDVEETTRKIAPTMVMPNFGPMPTATSSGFGSASINTTQIKASSQASVATSTKQEDDHVYEWELQSVPVLPEFHPLEKSAVFIPNTTPSVIAQRISHVLRDRSIEASYDDDKAKVKCVTSEGVDFRIRLYRGRNQYNHGIIVEVQRRFGSSLVFFSDTQAILDAAQGKAVAPPPMMTSLNNLPEVSDDEEDYDEDDDIMPSATSSLSMVSKMLSLPGFDSQYLGLQTLSSLVDPEKLSLTTARSVATNLLRSDSEVGLKVFGYVVSRKATGDEDDIEAAMALRNMSLNILANAMKSCGQVPEFLREPLRPVLIADLCDASNHPNTALLAARCIEYFIRGDNDTMELNEVFEIARKVGESRHANLMNQAEKCISAIR
jgi:hypothetical protein